MFLTDNLNRCQQVLWTGAEA